MGNNYTCGCAVHVAELLFCAEKPVNGNGLVI